MLLRFITVFFVVLIASALLTGAVVRQTAPDSVAISTAEAGTYTRGEVTLRGTLTYAVNNVGASVPYIVFRSASGAVETKALVFSVGSVCDSSHGSYPCPLIASATPYYFGSGPVLVTGRIVAEHVVTHSLVAVAG